mgnify:CR=1 FL=1
MNKDRELAKLIKQHQLWLKTNRSEGQRLDLSGAHLDGADFSGVDLSGAIFVGASLNGARFSNSLLVHADFTDASLSGANFRQANLILTDFSSADLQGADFQNTIEAALATKDMRGRGPSFKDARLDGAKLQSAYCYLSDFSSAQLDGSSFNSALLERACLARCDLTDIEFTQAKLTSADLTAADLTGASFNGADLTHANLEQAILSSADITDACLLAANLADARVDDIQYNGATRFKGARVNSCYGSARFKRYAQDQDFIEEYREAHPLFFWLWWCTTACGRSLSLVGFWCLIQVLSFALAYFLLGETQFFIVNSETLSWNFFTALYYSVETFSAFGQGDITPKTPMAAVIVTVEVIVGYIMLGILISILATKVARRS